MTDIDRRPTMVSMLSSFTTRAHELAAKLNPPA